MPQTTPTRPGRTCPNCRAFVPQGNPRCQSCRLEVKQMDNFAAAKKAAQARGKRGVSDEPRETPFYLRPGIIAAFLLLACVAGGAAYLLRPRPPRYVTFPATADATVQQFLTHISAGTDPEYLKAYAMIADSARDPKADDEAGDYTQVFHTMNQYLSGEFGDGWAATAKLVPDPADPNVILAHISMETLRIHTQQQTPPDKMKAYNGPHYAVMGVDDFSVQDAASLRQMAGITDILGGLAGQGAVNNLNTILGASAANRHLPRMMEKISLLAVNRDPRTTTWKSIIQMYPLRDDPVVKNRLTMITNDERYDPAIRDKAKLVLANRVPEEDFVAAGVPY